MKVLALDYGSARTGVAVSDPTGTVARPLTTVERAATEAGFAKLLAVIAAEEPELVVVGMPLTLRGDARRAGARDDRVRRAAFALRCRVPVETYDERFTSVLAGGDDARAAAHLLSELSRVAEQPNLSRRQPHGPRPEQIRRRRLAALLGIVGS